VEELLGDTLDVAEGYRRAFQAVLGPAVYYYLTNTIDAALKAVESLRQAKVGQTTFIPISDFHATDIQQFTVPEGAVGRALDLLNGGVKSKVLAHFLGRVVIVNDWQSALQHRAWALENRCTLVTLDGQWIDSTGLLRGGSEEVRTPIDLGLRKQVLELNQLLTETIAENEATGARTRDMRSQRSVVEQKLVEIQRKLESIRLRQANVREEQVKQETLLASLEQRETTARQQIEELDRAIGECSDQIRAAMLDVEKAKADLHDSESSGGNLSDKFAEARTAVARARDHRHECEKLRDAFKHRVELVEADIQRVEQTLAEIAENLQGVEDSAEHAVAEITALEKRIKEIEDILLEKFRSRDHLAQVLDRATTRLDQARSGVKEHEDRLRKLREDQDAELEGERKIELEYARLRGELDALISNARNQFGFDLTAEDFVQDHAFEQETEANPELVQELKQKIERLGPVNLLAVEEYEKENARLEALLRNRDDLLNAKQTLVETITRINETAQARFLHTFEAVRANFQRLFREFFGAGEADLILNGPDLLEADITLWANPSGKRLKSLSLMSGGEKTMTAIALLFSLYQVKPSPFCIFDEVDAPLDDVNIDRFNRMIRLHSTDTQFILVTHNKRTMETADNLYGVTMEEEGVSKLVSVRLLTEVA
jgi:chromosome segregation protein